MLPKPSAAALLATALMAATPAHASGPQGVCPPGAVRLKAAFIDWDRIRSDAEAVACLRAIAAQLGPDATQRWLRDKGFRATFIKQFSDKKGRLLSAGWPIRKRGLLYSPGIAQGAIVKTLAYSQTFSFVWEGDRLLRVSQSYTFE